MDIKWLPTSNNLYRIFSVSSSDLQTSPQQLAAYRSSDSSKTNYIFLSNKFSELNLFEKFFMFHELGHSLHFVSNSIMLSRHFRSFPILILPLLLLFTSLNLFTICLFFFYTILLFLIQRHYETHSLQIAISEEIHADRFALNLLTKQEKEQLKNLLDSVDDGYYKFFRGTSSTDKVANERLKSAIGILNGWTYPHFFIDMYTPTLYFIILSGIVFSLGFYMRESFILIIVGNFIFLTCILIYSYTQKHVTNLNSYLIHELLNALDSSDMEFYELVKNDIMKTFNSYVNLDNPTFDQLKKRYENTLKKTSS